MSSEERKRYHIILPDSTKLYEYEERGQALDVAQRMNDAGVCCAVSYEVLELRSTGRTGLEWTPDEWES